MNIFFTVVLAVYIIILMVLGIIDLKKVRTFADYAVAGKNQSLFAVTMTLLATMIGGSTTIGIADTVYRIGFPGMWWLTFGSIGLVLQALLISEKVRRIDADTLPDLAHKLIGRSAETLLAVIIVIAWIGVVAGQLIAMNGIITYALGHSSTSLFIIVSVLVILYTFIGGQMSVIRTDRIQLCIIVASIAAVCIWLYGVRGSTENVLNHIELINEDYKPVNLLTQLFVIGGVYFLGPDIMSRNFISRNELTAKKASLIAGGVFFLFALLITFVGMWIRYNVSPEELSGSKALMFTAGIVHPVIGVGLTLGLLSAVLSSTDTCLINAASIFVKDILHRDSVLLVRITVCVIGLISMLIALLGRGDIIGLLTSAYSIYTPGVICPLTVAILAYGSRQIRTGLWLTAVCLGGIFGLLGTVFGDLLTSLGIPQTWLSSLPLIGMGVSLVTALLSVKWKQRIIHNA